MRGGVDGVGIGVVSSSVSWYPAALRHRQHPQALLGKVVHQRLRVILIGLRVGEPAARQDDFRGALEHQQWLCRIRAERADRGGEATAGLERNLGEQVPLRHRLAVKRRRSFDDRLVGGVRMALRLVRLGRCARGGLQNPGAPAGSATPGNGPCGSVAAGTERTRRSRFSVSVPVLSKQIVSTRPSASMVRGARTSTPRVDSRWAAAS